MATFVYRCPSSSLQVQGWVADDPEKGEEFCEALTCTACGVVHLVYPETGNVLGADGKK
jgi:hypothetical protein